MRTRPYAFLRIADRWLNMAMVTDIVDQGETLVVFMASDMARMTDGGALDVARRFTVDDRADVEKMRRWLKLNDED